MTEPDHSAKKQVDTITTNISQEGQVPHDVPGSGSFHAMQQAIKKPSKERFTANDVLQLQRAVGNRAVKKLLADAGQRTNDNSYRVHPPNSSHAINRLPDPDKHIGDDVVNVTFEANHPVSKAEVSPYRALKKAKKRTQKNTIVGISTPELKQELRHMIGAVTPQEFAAGNNIKKETSAKYDWITSSTTEAEEQTGGNQKISVGLNRRNGKKSDQMWISHLAHEDLVPDKGWLDNKEKETRVDDYQLRKSDEAAAESEANLASYYASLDAES